VVAVVVASSRHRIILFIIFPTFVAAGSHHYVNMSGIPFREFDERGEVRIYQHGDLPHWRQDECTYFVTFRQADSLPASVMKELEAERCAWLRRHGIDPTSDKWQTEFSKLTAPTRRECEQQYGITLEKHLDVGYGTSVLQRREVGELVSNALQHFHNRRVLTGDFVVMPNHVHVLMRPLPGFELENIVHSVKSFTSNQINGLLDQSGEFWQRQCYDRIVRDFDQLEAYQQYIMANPKKAALREGQFVLRQATWYPEDY